MKLRKRLQPSSAVERKRYASAWSTRCIAAVASGQLIKAVYGAPPTVAHAGLQGPYTEARHGDAALREARTFRALNAYYASDPRARLTGG